MRVYICITVLVADFGIIVSETVAQAMIKTDRKYYSPGNPYMDAPQSIGYGVTISAPHMVNM